MGGLGGPLVTFSLFRNFERKGEFEGLLYPTFSHVVAPSEGDTHFCPSFLSFLPFSIWEDLCERRRRDFLSDISLDADRSQ